MQAELRMYCGDVPNASYDAAKCEGEPPFRFFVSVVGIGLACIAGWIATIRMRRSSSAMNLSPSSNRTIWLSIALLVALTIAGVFTYWWPWVGASAGAQERGFENSIHHGMTRAQVIAVARQNGGNELDYGTWSTGFQKGTPFSLYVAIAEAGGLCWVDWMVYSLAFDREGKLKSWYRSKQTVAC